VHGVQPPQAKSHFTFLIFLHEKNPKLEVSQSFAHEGNHVEKKVPSLE
jgi:hypothetical protein